MNGFIRLVILSAMIASLTSCASRPVEDDLSLDGAESTEEVAAADSETSEGSEDFSDFEESDVDKQAQTEQAPAEPQQAQGDQDLAVEEEVNQAGVEQPADVPPPTEQAAAEPPPPEPTQEAAPTEDPFADSGIADNEPTPPAEPVQTETIPSPVQETSPQVAAPTGAPANITDLQFKANESGGTIIVQADKPLSYTTRTNPELRQYIIEVNNAILPDRLKRSLNTRDIKGSVGAIDAYQNPGSNTARFVIQLREGVGEPAVQTEGNSLLVVASGGSSSDVASQEPQAVQGAEVDGESQILPSQNLTEFLAGNNKFYGKKISLETNNMDIRDALNFITEESGVNMVISEDVKGAVSLKLRQVPWDQALVVIMKAKKLGYTRQGNVLRIAPQTDLRAEEDDATKMAQARKNIEPLKVRMFPVSYARVEELEKKIKDFLGDRGRVVGDARTNALVVTDIEENLERAAKLIASLDTQPPQVLIEGKIVEAKESFTRNIGVNWGASGSPIKLGSTARGPVNMNPSFNVNPGANTPGNLNFNLAVGTLDVFGTLQAALSLSESEEQVKIISAPRIMTMTNERADINQTTEVPVRQVTQNGTATQETFQFKPLTLRLEVTPQVTADGSVIMKVLVNRQFRGADVSSAGQGAFAVNSREANTRVLVKNGQTAVIGGIYQSDATDGETGVPWFRELPFVSYLFKTKNISKEKSELLIFLTPRIVGQLDTGVTAAPNTQDF
ncbi:type IV pilus secretin PilQ [Bdellovibrio reynosensis]|uniref:Type IV pilus secretin PilQ n=1 Tax=Bdellovibrio reynosensis TaxID=2835041 RepID=A0ABY4CD80_9BACT|nr:type IV pilus secretin PilQ [Bdellovibrio reynosensis]UOF02931.1 type IV pilus secretin PilQ [Bdellovibrio reynosensis]